MGHSLTFVFVRIVGSIWTRRLSVCYQLFCGSAKENLRFIIVWFLVMRAGRVLENLACPCAHKLRTLSKCAWSLTFGSLIELFSRRVLCILCFDQHFNWQMYVLLPSFGKQRVRGRVSMSNCSTFSFKEPHTSALGKSPLQSQGCASIDTTLVGMAPGKGTSLYQSFWLWMAQFGQVDERGPWRIWFRTCWLQNGWYVWCDSVKKMIM